MPLNIIRNDITKVTADAIVNTANPMVAIGAGVDRAIYEAAGEEELLAERSKIGPMEPGQAAATPAFGLVARYIIHTVGPVWEGGDYGEREAVASCYRESLRIADELGCESIAFPLISTGTYGFPKDEALQIAVREISAFLFGHEMTVYMVVYDRESFVLSGKAYSDIRSFIEEKDVKMPPADYARRSTRLEREMQRQRRRRAAKEKPNQMGFGRESGKEEEDLYPRTSYYKPARWEEEEERLEERPKALFALSTPEEEDQASAPNVRVDDIQALYAPVIQEDAEFGPEFSVAGDLDDVLARRANSFQQLLFWYIDHKDMTDTEVYKKANLDRKLFSKIRSREDYRPQKKTIVALAIALRLNLDETVDLLRRAGYALSPSSAFDLIVRYCIENRIYDIFEINNLLFKYDQPLLGA